MDDEVATVPFFLTGATWSRRCTVTRCVELTGERAFHHEKRELLQALYQCGARFCTFYSRLWDGHPDRALDVTNLDQARAATAAALARL